MCFASHFLRLVEIQPYLFKIQRDLIEIQPVLFEIHQDLAKIQRDLFEIRPNLFEIHRDLFEIRPDFGRSVQSQPNLVVSSKILHSFKIFNSDQGPTGIQGGPTTPTDSIHRSAMGPEMREPKLSGRLRDEHKLDLD